MARAWKRHSVRAGDADWRPGFHQSTEITGKYQAHYDQLFGPLEAEHGKLDAFTLTGIVGFNAGGPVSLSCIASRDLYVTCELSVSPDQAPSVEGFNFELLVRGWLGESPARDLLTALGDLSQGAQLGDGHTVDVSGVLPEGHARRVRLREYSRASIDGREYGIYEVLAATDH